MVLGACTTPSENVVPISASAAVAGQKYSGSDEVSSLTELFQKAELPLGSGSVKGVQYFVDSNVETYVAIRFEAKCRDVRQAVESAGMSDPAVVRHPMPLSSVIDASLEYGWGLQNMSSFMSSMSQDRQKSIAFVEEGSNCQAYYVLSTF